MVNFYNRFIPHVAHLVWPLNKALGGKYSKDEVDWPPETDKAFNDTKAALANAALLARPSLTAPVALMTDASDYVIGAVCKQWVGGTWQRHAFFSKRLRDDKRKYSTFDWDLLGLFLAIRHFKFLLEGHHFTAFVDHKTSEPWSGHQQRQLTTDIQHMAGKDKLVVDCLSRVAVGSVHLEIHYTAMATDQATDTAIQAYHTTTTELQF